MLVWNLILLSLYKLYYHKLFAFLIYKCFNLDEEALLSGLLEGSSTVSGTEVVSSKTEASKNQLQLLL